MSLALLRVSWDAPPLPGPTANPSPADPVALVARWRYGATDAGFDPDPLLEPFAEACSHAGLPVRVGRSTEDPRVVRVLVESSGLQAAKDRLLEDLWKRHQVDSLTGGRDYQDRVLFGIAAGRVAERWGKSRTVEGRPLAVAADATGAAALLHVAQALPEVGLVLHVRETALGRALAGLGPDPVAAAGARPLAELAAERGVTAEHTLEVACARGVDTIVCEAAVAAECTRFLGRTPDVVVPAATLPAAWLDAFATAARTAVQRAAGRARANAAAPGSASRASEPSRHPRTFPLRVSSPLPPALLPLARLARNYHFAWNPGVAALFEEVSPSTWDACRHDPLRLLEEARSADLEAKAGDAAFLGRLARALDRTKALLTAPTPASALSTRAPVAYFSAEFGIHESLPVYSGGLGILAGDHLKSASDLGLPLVAVGILYRKGYFRQRLSGGVEQAALPEEVDPTRLPLEPVVDGDGTPVEVPVPVAGRSLLLRTWRASVGRTTLHLLDADHPGNSADDRRLTHELYGGDGELRLLQEIVLGRGGVRLLARLGIEPAVFHQNEGHGAFVAVERAARLVSGQKLTFDEALEVVRATTVFTTHTPVPAGHDRFDEDLARRHLSDLPGLLGIPWERLFALGVAPDEPGRLNMTRLAVATADRVNGVSRRHAEVTRGLVRRFLPHLLEAEVPVRGVTNGVHLPTWTAPEVATLLGAGDRPVAGADFAASAPRLDARALWEVRGRLKARLGDHVRRRIVRSFEERGDDPGLRDRVLAGLDPRALWIGFARRFATYKRADLLFSDLGRLQRILDDPERPVRVLLAGKAHPKDASARELLARVGRLARSDELAGRVVLLEDYAMDLARLLVQGVDVWLNTPRPPMEASGTSGMKAAANGVLNLSVGDGWWPEAYDGTNGWRIGDGPRDVADVASDASDAAHLFRLLEDEVVPAFFRRDDAGPPTAWLDRVRRSLATIPPVFDSTRMVAEYRDTTYLPAAAQATALAADGWGRAKALAAERARVRRGFQGLKVLGAEVDEASPRPGEPIRVRARVDLAGLATADVRVEALVGRSRDPSSLDASETFVLAPTAEPGRFEGAVRVPSGGSWAFAVRARPAGAPGPSLHDPVAWA